MSDQSGHPGGSGHNLHNLNFAKFSILSSASLDGFSVLFNITMKVNPVQRPELPGKAASSRHEEVSPVQGLLEVAFQEAGLH